MTSLVGILHGCQPTSETLIMIDKNCVIKAVGSFHLNGKFLRVRTYDLNMIFFMLRHFSPENDLDIKGFMNWRGGIDENGDGAAYVTLIATDMSHDDKHCVAKKETDYTLLYSLLLYILKNFDDEYLISSKASFEAIFEIFKQFHEIVLPHVPFSEVLIVRTEPDISIEDTRQNDNNTTEFENGNQLYTRSLNDEEVDMLQDTLQ